MYQRELLALPCLPRVPYRSASVCSSSPEETSLPLAASAGRLATIVVCVVTQKAISAPVAVAVAVAAAAAAAVVVVCVGGWGGRVDR